MLRDPLLDQPIGKSGLPGAGTLRRVGPRLDILTTRDLLFHLPRRYDDLREMRRIGDLAAVDDGETVSARVRVVRLRTEMTYRRRVQRTIALLADETGEIEATWFGRRYIERRLKEGDWVVVSGRLKRRGWAASLDNPEFQREDGREVLHAGRIVPVYPLTSGLTAARLRSVVRAALDGPGRDYPEYLPESIRRTEALLPIERALEEVHFPTDFEARDAALRRLAFDELLALQVGMVQRRRQRGASRATPVPSGDVDDRVGRESVVAALCRRAGEPVALTADQEAAMDAIRADIARPVPMVRLLQGDVGSGKTAVAAYALALAARTGRQGALLAPTDLLARQHAATLGELLDGTGIPVTLLTGSLSSAGRTAALDAVASGQAPVVVGTHAILQEKVRFADLALAVIDEQHRFGVAQRALLEAKASGLPPHVLLMTATPIPRTLGQVLYADLDVSDLRTKPAGRGRVRTVVRRPDELERLWDFVAAEAAEDRRTFVVVPLIEESEDEPVAAAEAEAVRLRERLGMEVGLVHGRMKAADRDAEMGRFRDGQVRVLVGTTVIEVGVDVPEATVMIVEGADRFGLAQLHQLRGRVGRGTAAEAYCVLVSDAAPGSVGEARLRAAEELTDGFALAERDFELRREGDVLGLVQSGLPRLRVASLQRQDHRELAARARGHAESLLDDGGGMPSMLEPLQRELEVGWLRDVAAGEPASAV
jgi:ATP-dependent DNA helicase RecG